MGSVCASRKQRLISWCLFTHTLRLLVWNSHKPVECVIFFFRCFLKKTVLPEPRYHLSSSSWCLHTQGKLTLPFNLVSPCCHGPHSTYRRILLASRWLSGILNCSSNRYRVVFLLYFFLSLVRINVTKAKIVYNMFHSKVHQEFSKT